MERMFEVSLVKLMWFQVCPESADVGEAFRSVSVGVGPTKGNIGSASPQSPIGLFLVSPMPVLGLSEVTNGGGGVLSWPSVPGVSGQLLAAVYRHVADCAYRSIDRSALIYS